MNTNKDWITADDDECSYEDYIGEPLVSEDE